MGDRRVAETESKGGCTDCSEALRSEAIQVRSAGPESAKANPSKVSNLYDRLNVNPSTDDDDIKYLTKDELKLALDNHQASGYTALTEQEKELVHTVHDEFNIVRHFSRAKGEDNDGVSRQDLQIFVDKNAERLWRPPAGQRQLGLGSEIGQFFKIANLNLSNDRNDPQFLTEKELNRVLSDDQRDEGRLLTPKQREIAHMLLTDFDRVRKFSDLKGEDNDGISFYDLKIFAENNKGYLEAFDRSLKQK